VGDCVVTSEQMSAVLGVTILYPLVRSRFGKAYAQVDHFVHVVGFAIGGVAGWFLRRKPQPAALEDTKGSEET
jgi:membrane associated rhomboid family serine protease